MTYAPGSQVLSADLNKLLVVTGLQTMPIPLVGNSLLNGVDPPNSGQITMDATHTELVLPLYGLAVGSRIVQLRASIADSAVGPTKMDCSLLTIIGGGTTTNGNGTQSAGSGSQQTIQSTVINFTVVNAAHYYLKLKYTTGVANCTVYWAQVDVIAAP